MQFSAAKNTSPFGASGGLDTLVRQIGRLVRHPAYRRNRVVSAVLLRHLPMEAGYSWQGEAGLLARLTSAKLDAATLNHLIGSVQAEYMRLRGPADA
ncbi:hypothetical protein [Methylobacterium persicinum]|uniref:hypothetical protein n=1 Tax=Methylobacterium persicinum TaxID=374426 RepID=UPI001EE27D46|nr:hypothetical protein [Methylobacterium persicinum]GJE38495.1 hypothetical protein KHHGKMAE_2568 [Methylobacterium persicinum]